MAELRKYKLGELCKLSSSKRIFESEYVKNGIPFIRGQEISDKSILDDNAKFECYISEARYNELKEKYGVPQKGDILMTAVGTIGNLVVLNSDRPFYFKDGNVIRFSDFAEIVDSTYLSFFMKSPYFNKQIEYALIGAVQKALTMVMLTNIEIPLSDLIEQKRIAKVLSTIDRKITINREINRNLEELAKQIYDYWFVQFDFPNEEGMPYKSSGGKMVWNETLKREIPADWEVKLLKDIIEIKRGITITEKQTTSGTIKVVAAGLTYSYLHGESNRTPNCITVSGSGANAGFVNFWREPIFASDCSTIQFDNDIDTILCYYTLKKQEKRFYQISHKSAQPHILPSDIGEIPMIIPSNSIKERISQFFIKTNIQIAEYTKELEHLSSLRDNLLPLLMNGQVTLNSCLSAD